MNPALLKSVPSSDIRDELLVGAPEDLFDKIFVLVGQGEAENWRYSAYAEAQDA
jgi:hypothetical protein